VFRNNLAHSVVNGSLWTIPFEIGCYILVISLILSKCLHRRKLVLALCAAFVIIGMGVCLTEPITPEISSIALRNVFVGDGSRLFISFLLGIAAYVPVRNCV
jgi:peptidoglycan/LPS O-acetylase OafA/YrhL